MTGIRQSIVFSAEDTYGQGKGSGKCWIAPPPGTFFTSTHNRNVQRVQSTGSKFWDTQAYGQLSGSWSWTFTFDYGYLEPFYFAFENITFTSPGNVDVLGKGTTSRNPLFKFEKVNNQRIKSFTVRRKINNVMVGGSNNEVTELTGCVVKSIQFSRNASTSKIDVSLSGFYANEILVLDDNTSFDTDFTEYDDSDGLSEYACLYIGNMNDGEYMANTEQVSISIDNSAAQVFSICSPFASNYYEGLTNISFSTTCYSTDPRQYKTRLYGGGQQATPIENTTNKYMPMSKGLRPVPEMSLVAYSNQIQRDDPQYQPSTETGADNLPAPNVKTAFAGSDKFIGFDLEQVVIKSMPWQKGDGSKLQDSLSGSEVRKLTMYVKAPGQDPQYWFNSGPTNTAQNKIAEAHDPDGKNFPSS